ncbi:MAG: hypothetical protein LBP81_08350, partial [Treponema sp.]|nr:hypothetical protein [Treponema sp.]
CAALTVAEGARAENSQAKVPDSDETPKSRGFDTQTPGHRRGNSPASSSGFSGKNLSGKGPMRE